jgi:hypothetical protein
MWKPISFVPRDQRVLLANFKGTNLIWAASGIYLDPEDQYNCTLDIDSSLKARATHWAPLDTSLS